MAPAVAPSPSSSQGSSPSGDPRPIICSAWRSMRRSFIRMTSGAAQLDELLQAGTSHRDLQVPVPDQAFEGRDPALAEDLEQARGRQVFVEVEAPLVPRPEGPRREPLAGPVPGRQLGDEDGQRIGQLLPQQVIRREPTRLAAQEGRPVDVPREPLQHPGQRRPRRRAPRGPPGPRPGGAARARPGPGRGPRRAVRGPRDDGWARRRPGPRRAAGRGPGAPPPAGDHPRTRPGPTPPGGRRRGRRTRPASGPRPAHPRGVSTHGARTSGEAAPDSTS